MNLAKPDRSRQYELTYLLPVSLTAAETKAAHEQVESLVKKHKGTVVSKQDWGKKQMAYRIKRAGTKHAEALYTHAVLEFDTSIVPTFEKDIYLMETIIRHLLVVAGENLTTEEAE